MATCQTQMLEINDATLYGAKYIDCVTLGSLKRLFSTDSIMMNMEIEEGDSIYYTEVDAGARFVEEIPIIGSAITLGITTKDLNEKANEILTQSTSQDLLQVAQIDISVNIASSEIGVIEKVGYFKLSSFALANTTTPATIYIEGQDYKVNFDHGTVEILGGGSIVDGTDITATISVPEIVDGKSYDYGDNFDKNDWYLEAHTKSTTGVITQYQIHKVRIKPSGESTIKGETKTASVLTIEGTVLKVGTKQPYTKIVIPA